METPLPPPTMKTTTDSLSSAPLDIDSSREPLPTSGLSGLRGSAGLALMTVLAACRAEDLVNYGSLSDGSGGGQPCLTLPFEAGQEWVLTRGYGTEECLRDDRGNLLTSHCDYDFSFGDDQFAFDFGMSGCTKDEYGNDEDYLSYGQPVYPMATATVESITDIYAGDHDQGYGNSVILDHSSGYFSRYAHLSEISNLSVGDSVDINTKIGEVGNTGITFGDACPVHSGTHLHVVLYKLDDDNQPKGIPPEPLSGYSDMMVGSSYERQGNGSDSVCDENSSESDGSDNHEENNDDSDGVKITFADISPHSGSEEETAFVWVAIVDSPYDKPDANLWIYNPDDRHSYEFEMETESEGNPWVFTYQKTLNDNLDYKYWILASGENRDGEHTNDVTDEEVEIDVDRRTYDEPEDYSQSNTTHGEAGVTEFDWRSTWESDDRPDVELKIVSAQDNRIYSFDMEVSGDDGLWEATYEKTLRDSAIYTFWMEADNGESTNTTRVKSIDVTD